MGSPSAPIRGGTGGGEERPRRRRGEGSACWQRGAPVWAQGRLSVSIGARARFWASSATRPCVLQAPLGPRVAPRRSAVAAAARSSAGPRGPAGSAGRRPRGAAAPRHETCKKPSVGRIPGKAGVRKAGQFCLQLSAAVVDGPPPWRVALAPGRVPGGRARLRRRGCAAAPAASGGRTTLAVRMSSCWCRDASPAARRGARCRGGGLCRGDCGAPRREGHVRAGERTGRRRREARRKQRG